MDILHHRFVEGAEHVVILHHRFAEDAKHVDILHHRFAKGAEHIDQPAIRVHTLPSDLMGVWGRTDDQAISLEKVVQINRHGIDS